MRYYIAIVFFLCALPSIADAQTCNLKISGIVLDRKAEPMPGAVIKLLHSSSGAVADLDGKFVIEHLCPATDTLTCEAIGYNKTTTIISLIVNSTVKITMSASENNLGEVIINGKKEEDLHTSTQTALTGLALLQTRGLSLGESVKELAGVNTMQTGPTLSKPVIHGMHSNRVLLINDGVRQEGQQWGSEHAPEIDPFIANNISVIKGAATVRYGADAVAGVVIVNPDPLPTTKGIHGDAYLVSASNGQMGAFSGMLEGAFDKKLSGLSWRVQGTLKAAGNFRTADYYLYNTGLHEGDFSGELGYQKNRFKFSAFYSMYTTEVGIFSGSEADGLADLEQKINSTRPLTPDIFTYNIDREYQTISHNLLKGMATYEFKNNGSLELTVARQKDLRQEFGDVPYGSSPELYTTPDLRFQLITHSLDLIYTQPGRNNFSGSFGITSNTSGNTCGGLDYLIPNYRDYNAGAFAIERYTFKKLTIEAGIRYDYRWMQVYQLDSAHQGQYNTTYQYNNITGTVGGIYHFNDQFAANLNVGTAWRAPSVNELFAQGVHFSDASYDMGDSSLKSERAVNTSLSLNYTSKKLRATVDLYYNKISNYIYDMPLQQIYTSASGSYLEFSYTQDNVNIKGIDALITYDIIPRVTVSSKTTIVRGYNETINNYLIAMPADRFQNSIEYHLEKIGKAQQPYISLENITVARQNRVPPNVDYAPPPPAYTLFNANVGCMFPLGKNTLAVNFAVDNMANMSYRDYMNHFRYYCDDLGINFILRLKYSF